MAVDPCQPNPCGPNSNPPRTVGEQCQCSCLPTMIGSPPNCRPECVINSDCSPDKACINQKCQDPCPGLCGINAACRVRNHVPICVCNPGYTGDPFSSCFLQPSETCCKKVLANPFGGSIFALLFSAVLLMFFKLTAFLYSKQAKTMYFAKIVPINHRR